MAASKKSNRPSSELTPRYAWLAALGAFAVARREAFIAADIVVEETVRLRRQLGAFGEDASAIARGGAITLREKIEPVLAQLSAGVEARLGPVLDRLGLPRLAERAPHKPRKATKKTSGRRAAPRKVAERARARTQR